ncbi:hypothetical protein HY572_03270 [Candidatus Micrarchaeota archaeon]|nr:hypothetical protein [Candidatus Micrarchaeota archaeon]
MLSKFSIYKPNKAGRGSAVQFDFNPDKPCVFLEGAPQSGEKQFDWGQKVVVKLSIMELAKLLTVLEGPAKTVKLFHDSTKSPTAEGSTLKNTVVEVTKGDFGFFLKASAQSATGVKSVAIGVGDEEAKALSVLFRRAIARVYGW